MSGSSNVSLDLCRHRGHGAAVLPNESKVDCEGDDVMYAFRVSHLNQLAWHHLHPDPTIFFRFREHYT